MLLSSSLFFVTLPYLPSYLPQLNTTQLTSHFSPLSLLGVCNITVSDIPQELFATPNEAEKALQAIQLRKATGPDGLPNIILKEFAFELGPVISDIYNASLREGYIPSLLKSANVRP